MLVGDMYSEHLAVYRFDEARGEIAITPSIGKARISALAIDEKSGRIWFATAEDGAVRCVGLNGKVVATLGAAVPHAGALALDHTVAVWVTQREQPEKLMPVTGAVFSSDAAGWPDCWITLPSDQAVRGLRLTGPQVSLRNLTVFTCQPSIPGRVLRFSATRQPLPQTITEIMAPGGLFADHAHQRLLVCDAGAAHQVRAYRDLNGRPALDPSFGTRGLFGIAGGVYADRGGEIGRIGEQRFDGLRGVGLDAVSNMSNGAVGMPPVKRRKRAGLTRRCHPGKVTPGGCAPSARRKATGRIRSPYAPGRKFRETLKLSNPIRLLKCISW